MSDNSEAAPEMTDIYSKECPDINHSRDSYEASGSNSSPSKETKDQTNLLETVVEVVKPIEETEAEVDVPSTNYKKTDKYGFFVSNEFHKALELDEVVSARRINKSKERTNKWIYMMKHWELYTTSRIRKLKSRIRKGIPEPFRGFTWYHISNAEAYKSQYPNLALVDLKVLNEVTADEVLAYFL